MWPFASKITAVPTAPATEAKGGLLSVEHLAPSQPLVGVREHVNRTMIGKAPGFTADSNSDALIGANDTQLTWYSGQGFIGFQTCALIAQNWLVEKCCWMPARDAARTGYEVTVNDGSDVDPETLDRIKKIDARMNINNKMIEFAAKARVFGIRIAMFKVQSTDPDYYFKPFNPDGVTPGSYRGIAQIDPYWVSPILDQASSSEPDSTRFYEPTWWIINGKQVHHSHLIIARINEVADILKPSYLYAGVSVVQRIYERVYAAERTANEAPLLAMTKRMDIFYTNTAKALTNQGAFEVALLWWRQTMDNFGVKVADKDADRIERLDTSLTDLDVVIMTQFQLVAAAANIPATKLMGTQPKGFNSTGEYEEATYREELEGIQCEHLLPFLERHLLLLSRSMSLGIELTATFQPLDSPTAKEVAEINKIKAETGKVLVDSGAIDGIDERARVTADPDSGYTGLAEVAAEGDPIG